MKWIPVIRNPRSPYLHIIDNGHGIETPGKRSGIMSDGGEIREYAFTRDIAGEICYNMFKNKQNYVVLVPEINDVPLLERGQRCKEIMEAFPEFPNRKGFSIHGNAFGLESANGIEIWTAPGYSPIDTAAHRFTQIAAELGMTMRLDMSDNDGDKESRFYMTWGVQPWVDMALSENGFYTNEHDYFLMKDPAWKSKCANVHNKVINYIEKKGL